MTMPTRLATPPTITLAVAEDLPAAYDVPFKFVDATDLTVTHINRPGEQETPLVLGVDYTVAGGNFDVGSIILLAAPGGPPDVIRIDRNSKDDQAIDYRQGDKFKAESHERALDRLTMLVQELRRDTLTVSQIKGIIGNYVKAGAGIKINKDDGLFTIVNLWGDEFIRDTIGATLFAGTGMSITPDDDANQIRINCTVQGVDTMADVVLLSGDAQSGGVAPGGGASFAETVLDLLGASITGVGLTVDFDDATNTITITNPMTAAAVQDLVLSSVLAGSGITATPGAGTVTIALAGTVLTDEDVRDLIGSTITNGTGIIKAIDDAGNTVTLNSDRLAPDYKGLVPSVIAADFFFQPSHNGRAINRTGGIAYLDVNSSTPLPDGWATVIRNTGAGPLTISRIAGVELYKQGTTVNANATIAPGGMATIQRWDVDEFTIAGPGVS